MPDPGSHGFDIKRTRRRGKLERDEVPSVPDQHADQEARAELEREHPPRLRDDPRAPGPAGGSGRGELRGEISLRTPAFSDHDFIPDRYAKQGENVSPPLEWSGVPDGTEELALLCEDPDAPRGTFVHWALLHLDPGTDGLAENETPSGSVAVRNGFGDRGWDGPMPPVGDDPHRYFFKLYALGRRLDLDADATGADVRAAVAEHAVASGTLVGRYAR
jgi:Raf kinase inhibitor-like YbhB/YbcL family protein